MNSSCAPTRLQSPSTCLSLSMLTTYTTDAFASWLISGLERTDVNLVGANASATDGAAAFILSPPAHKPLAVAKPNIPIINMIRH